MLALLCGIPGFHNQVGDRHAAPRGLQQRLNEAFNFGFWLCALKYVSDLPLPERGNGRHRLHWQAKLRQLAYERLIAVNIDLDEFHPASCCADDLFKDWRKGFTGPAPGGPEVDQHWCLP